MTTARQPMDDRSPTIALGVDVEAKVKLKLPHDNGISEALTFLFGSPSMKPVGLMALYELSG